jgi:hypothetical protein
MLNHPEIMWRYAETLHRQAELEGRRDSCRAGLMSALASPTSTRRQLRILGFRDR